MSRRRLVVGVLMAAAVLAVAVGVIVNLGEDAPDADHTDEPATDDGGPTPDERATGPFEDGPETSAASGQDGTRSLTQVPDELPAELVVDGAQDLEGRVARSGDDWSASVAYTTERTRDELADTADAALGALGFVSRSRSFDDEVMVIVYDGDDGSVVTVTVRDDPATRSLYAVRVSP